MSLLTKAIVTVIFIGLFVAAIYSLPSTQQFPLPPEFATSLALIIGYTFAWAQVFTCIQTLMACAIVAMSIEIVVWLWKASAWVIGKAAYFLA